MQPRKIKILAIDDSQFNLENLKMFISEAFPNFLIFCATTGDKGIELAITENPDVILLDILMLGMDGFEVCKIIKGDKNLRDIPVVFVTALKGDKANRIKALEVGAEAFLSKPIDEIELTAQLRAMLKIRKANLDKQNEKVSLAIMVQERTRELNETILSYLDMKENLKKENEIRKKSEEKFRSLFESIDDAIFISELTDDGKSSRFIQVNRAACERLGYTEEELLTKTAFEINSERMKSTFSLQFQNILVKKNAIIEGEHVTKDGRIIPVEVSIKVSQLKNKTVWYSIARDITERKQAEQLLIESEYFFKQSQMAASIGSYKTDFVKGFWKSSEVLDQIFGIDLNYNRTIEGWLDIVFPGDKEKMNQHLMEDVIAKRLPFNKEYRIIRKSDNEIRWVQGFGKVDFDSNGNILTMIGTIQDITERKQAESFQSLSNEILNVLNSDLTLKEVMDTVLKLIQWRTKISAVGIRLNKGGDFPYFSQLGFTDDFLLTENILTFKDKEGKTCRGKDGNPLLECTCGLVISGKTDPGDPLFTKSGSFITNDSYPILQLPPDQDTRLHPRNKCFHLGFNSIAIIPIRISENIIGTLQLNDKSKNAFTDSTISFFENIALSIGNAMMRKHSEFALQKSQEDFKNFIRNSKMAIYFFNAETKKIVYANPAFSQLLGYSPEEINSFTIYDFIINTKEEVDLTITLLKHADQLTIGERVWKGKDGTLFTILVNASSSTLENENIIYISGQNITEQTSN